MKGAIRVMPNGRRIATGRGIPWTCDQEALLVQMRANGATINAVCAALGFNRERVRDKLRNLDFKASDSKPSFEKQCLVCRAFFKSEGKHNRVCIRCTQSEAWRIGMTIIST